MEEPSLIELLKSLFKKKGEEIEDLTPEEIEFFSDLLDLKELEVRDFLIPRTQLKAIEEGLSWEEIKEYVILHPHTYYPVYRGSLDHYLGYVSLKDLVRGFKGSCFNWKDFMKEALTLPETMPVLKAVQKLKAKNLALGFLVDEHSEFVGIFRLKDFFEAIFFSPAKCFKADPEGWIRLPAVTKLHLLERCLSLEFPEGNYETLSGFILDHLKRIPQKGEKFIIPPIEVEVLDADPSKIKELKIRKVA